MFCPQCQAEYIEGVKLCRECGIPLVAELLPEPWIDVVYDETETIFASDNPALLAIAKSLLIDAGIKFTVKNEIGSIIFDGLTGFAGPVEIIVTKENATLARELLSEI